VAERRQEISFNGPTTVGAQGFGDGSSVVGSVASGPLAPAAGSAAKELSRTLIVVVPDVERTAVLEQVRALTGTAPVRRHLPLHTVYELGRISATEVMLAQVGQGTVRPDSGAAAVTELISELRPDHILLTGICYGLKERDPSWGQRLGDVVVAEQLRLIGHQRVGQAGDEGEVTYQSRGGEVHPSPKLVDRFRSAGLDWRGTAAVHTGPVLSESVLVDSTTYRQRLIAQHPEAIAGEMEGAGVYAAAMRGKVDWGLVKGISDFGYAKSYRHQAMAAGNAASFVVHMMAVGGLDPVVGVGQ